VKPLYIHDCDLCTFLGTSDGKSDLYVCLPGKTLIARHSSDGPDYTSGFAYVGVSTVITEAYVRAYRRGLVEITTP
jgi:hypothetical protein